MLLVRSLLVLVLLWPVDATWAAVLVAGVSVVVVGDVGGAGTEWSPTAMTMSMSVSIPEMSFCCRLICELIKVNELRKKNRVRRRGEVDKWENK